MADHDRTLETARDSPDADMTARGELGDFGEKTSLDSDPSGGNASEESASQRPENLTRYISVARSQNGYACDDGYDDEHEADGAGRVSRTPTHAFEVKFEGGDSDPDCPRSMGILRKWLIILIVSGGSFCVYVSEILISTQPANMRTELPRVPCTHQHMPRLLKSSTAAGSWLHLVSQLLFWVSASDP